MATSREPRRSTSWRTLWLTLNATMIPLERSTLKTLISWSRHQRWRIRLEPTRSVSSSLSWTWLRRILRSPGRNSRRIKLSQSKRSNSSNFSWERRRLSTRSRSKLMTRSCVISRTVREKVWSTKRRPPNVFKKSRNITLRSIKNLNPNTMLPASVFQTRLTSWLSATLNLNWPSAPNLKKSNASLRAWENN